MSRLGCLFWGLGTRQQAIAVITVKQELGLSVWMSDFLFQFQCCSFQFGMVLILFPFSFDIYTFQSEKRHGQYFIKQNFIKLK